MGIFSVFFVDVKILNKKSENIIKIELEKSMLCGLDKNPTGSVLVVCGHVIYQCVNCKSD